jgi:hypothetical protein
MTYYVVDRIEGKIAVVIGDDGRSVHVPKGALPTGSREGTVLRLTGTDWSSAEIDEAERVRRLDQARQTLRRLGESDDGGDIKL